MTTRAHDKLSEFLPILEQLGLSRAEGLVYMASLESGAEGASVIARRAGLKRGQTYNVLRSLVEQGLVQEFERSGTKQFIASDPESLLLIIERREEEIRQKRETLLTLLPALVQVRSPAVAPPKIQFYQGADGVREVILNTLAERDSVIYAFLDLEKRNIHIGDSQSEFIDEYAAERIERNIWLNAIVPQDSLEKEDKRRGSSGPIMRRHFKTLPGYRPTAEIYIHSGKVSIVTTWKQKIGLTIDDESIYNTYYELHRSLWSLLPETEEVLKRKEEVE